MEEVKKGFEVLQPARVIDIEPSNGDVNKMLLGSFVPGYDRANRSETIRPSRAIEMGSTTGDVNKMLFGTSVPDYDEVNRNSLGGSKPIALGEPAGKSPVNPDYHEIESKKTDLKTREPGTFDEPAGKEPANPNYHESESKKTDLKRPKPIILDEIAPVNPDYNESEIKKTDLKTLRPITVDEPASKISLNPNYHESETKKTNPRKPTTGPSLFWFPPLLPSGSTGPWVQDFNDTLTLEAPFDRTLDTAKGKPMRDLTSYPDDDWDPMLP